MIIKKHSDKVILAIGFTVLSNIMTYGQSVTERPIYLDPNRPIDKRVEDLLVRMTLEEKVGQLNVGRGNALDENERREFVKGIFSSRRLSLEAVKIGPGGGFFGLARKADIEFLNELQKTAVENTRLGIPLLETEEGTHGLMVPGATIFPEGLAIGSSWNMNLVRTIYSAAAREARAMGVHQLCTLVIEPNRDPRLGRNEEGYSEDPYLCSCIAEAIVNGAQGEDISTDDKVVAVLCHYPGQSQPTSGLERGPMEISERCLREVFLPPWEAGIKKAGALGVMVTYPAIDGIPAHGSKELLTKILREELGFKGCVLSEGSGFKQGLISEKVVTTQKEAGKEAIEAGVDISIWLEPAYMKPLIENVQEGKVSIETIDRAVRRILRVKFLLGLFEHQYADPDHALKVIHSKEHQELALQAAREGIVLLKNENNILPLDKNIKSIAVIGPNADNKRNQLGDYTAIKVSQDIVTVLDGIKKNASGKTKVTYVRGCLVLGSDTTEFSEARSAAKNADVAIVVVGENERFAPKGRGTTGEGKDVASLDLTGVQEDLIKAIYETGTPTIVVLINGRPLSIRWTAEHVAAILEAWHCGEQGGNAVAEVLFGDYNPGGHLPITIPLSVGQFPFYYNYKSSEYRQPYVTMSSDPLFEFGYGLSYTKFEYGNLHIVPNPPAERIGLAAQVHISLDVKNIGDRRGDEVVQLYVNDCISSVSTPVKELKGFQRITLNPNEEKRVEFTLTPYQLSLLDRHMERVVEPGTFIVMVGSSSKDIRLTGSFEVKD